MKSALHFFILLFSVTAFAQINFEPGYFIDNGGKRTDCHIKNIAWKNAPVDFEYRIAEGGENKKGVIAEVKEFAVNDAYKFIRFTVNIDRSASDVNKLSQNPQPEWSKEILFLKVLVEGKANLYQYEDSNFIKYFYSTGDHQNAEQLLYREFTYNNVIKENNMFRQQLFNIIKTDSSTNMQKFEKLRYKKKPLVDLFVEYNGTTGADTKNRALSQNQGSVNLKITPGAGIANLSVGNNFVSGKRAGDFEFSATATYRIGIEVEYILPFNNNKWSLFLDPNIQYYKSSDNKKVEFRLDSYTVQFDARYTYLEIPIGFRHYMYLNQNAKLFLDAAYVLAFNAGDNYVKVDDGANYLSIDKSSNAALGVGFAHNKLSVEFRYGFGRGLLDGTSSWNSKYTTAGLILGYRLF